MRTALREPPKHYGIRFVWSFRSVNHGKWEWKNHVVPVPKYRLKWNIEGNQATHVERHFGRRKRAPPRMFRREQSVTRPELMPTAPLPGIKAGRVVSGCHRFLAREHLETAQDRRAGTRIAPI